VALTKAEIVDALYERLGLSKKEAVDFVESVFEILKTELIKGEKIKISGFGNFTVRTKKPRKGRNPQTGEVLEIAGRRVLTFKPSQVLRAEVNAGSGTYVEHSSADVDSEEE